MELHFLLPPLYENCFPHRLFGCRFTKSGCDVLASSLKSNPAHMRVLDLSYNDFRDTGIEILSQFLAEPLCQLETLKWVKKKNMTGNQCDVLCSTDQSLKSLQPQHSSNVLDENNPTIEHKETNLIWMCPFSLKCCTLTTACCECLSRALICCSSLKELDMSFNKLQDQGVTLLSDWLKKPQCRLEILRWEILFTSNYCMSSAGS